MAKFKVGDRVRALNSYLNEFTRGKEYEITAVNRYSVSVALDDKGSTENGWGEDNFELIKAAWEPKVGDRVRWLGVFDSGYYTAGSVYQITKKLNDWSFGLTDDTVNKDTGSHQWNVSEVAKHFDLAPAAALTIEAGKFYRTRDGRKVGPIIGNWADDKHWPFRWPEEQMYYERGGFSCPGSRSLHRDADDLIAEWVDEPAVAASNDNAEPVAVKIGDTVRALISEFDVTEGNLYKVVEANLDGDARIIDDAGDRWRLFADEFELVTTPTTPLKTAIVALIENGQPKPADRPVVHADVGTATEEAERLAGKYRGKQFGVYILVDTRETDAPSYEHQWKNLAAAGEKIDAIKALRSLTGVGLKPAKDAVEYFLAA